MYKIVSKLLMYGRYAEGQYFNAVKRYFQTDGSGYPVKG